jgi:hypothetical protein
MQQGPWNFWHPDGSLDARQSGMYVDDVQSPNEDA